MSLSGTTRRLTASELAREPRPLDVLAWYDGQAQGAGLRSTRTYPRRLDASEARAWREGWADGWAERVHHEWHGFTPCPGGHPMRLPVAHEGEGYRRVPRA